MNIFRYLFDPFKTYEYIQIFVQLILHPLNIFRYSFVVKNNIRYSLLWSHQSIRDKVCSEQIAEKKKREREIMPSIMANSLRWRTHSARTKMEQTWIFGSSARNCNTISVRVPGHPLCFILWSHSKISRLFFCVWEVESL